MITYTQTPKKDASGTSLMVVDA